MTHDYYQKKKERKVWIPKSNPKAQRDPTYTRSNGLQLWCKRNTCMHRDGDLPAYIDVDGTRKWYQHGYLHRENNQPAVIWADGTREWWDCGVRQYPCGAIVADFIRAMVGSIWRWIHA